MDESDESQDEEIVDTRLLKRYAKLSMVDGRPWFFRMNGDRSDTGLLGYYGEVNDKGVMIAADVPGIMQLSKRFALFSLNELFNHVLKTVDQITDPNQTNHYYEVIGATHSKQKPYFDLDIDPTKFPIYVHPRSYAQQIVTLIISVVREEIGKLLPDVNITHGFYVCVYESRYPVDQATGIPKKFSYHIVFPLFHFADHLQMKQFGIRVKNILGTMGAVSTLASLAADAIDVIWAKTRQFRLLWSCKPGGVVKHKVDEKTFKPNHLNETCRDERIDMLDESLVSVISHHSILLNSVSSISNDVDGQ